MRRVKDNNRELQETMKSTGKTLALLALLALSLSVNTARGAVTANLDRNQVSLGDTLRLTLSASDGEDFDDAALQPLLEDFEIIQRSTSSNTSLVNGRLSRSRQMIVELSPRREGALRIPSMDFEGSNTNTLSVTVGPMPDGQSDNQPVIFEAEIDQNNVYVQGQIILTLRVQQAVNLEGRNISELKLDNAFVKPLEQHSFQRTIDGRPWLVDEVRYAVFPEQSGTLKIPAQTFSGRLRQGRRSVFDLGSTGRTLRRTTDPISIKVLPRPAGFTANIWLPSESVTLKETWSTPPDQLRAGESATRTIEILGRIKADGNEWISFVPQHLQRGCPFIPPVDSHDLDALVFREVHQETVFTPAFRAPGSPDIEQPHLSVKIGGAHCTCRVEKVGQGKPGGRLVDEHRGHIPGIQGQPNSQEYHQQDEYPQWGQIPCLHAVSAAALSPATARALRASWK